LVFAWVVTCESPQRHGDEQEQACDNQRRGTELREKPYAEGESGDCEQLGELARGLSAIVLHA
jgi:hypothetical protein